MAQLRASLRDRVHVTRPGDPYTPQRHSKPCHKSGKVRWLSDHDAWLIVLRLGNIGSYYRCPSCGSWHITRYPPKEEE